MTWKEEQEEQESPLDEPPEEFFEPRAIDHIEQNPALAPFAAIVETGRTHAEALAATPTEWAWQDYAPSGAITMIAGQPGGGKTTLLFQLLVARARSEVAGSCKICEREVYPAPQFRHILLIEAEHSSPSTARKLLKSCDLAGVSRDSLNRILWVARKSILIGDEKWKLVEELIAAGTISDVAIDTLARASPRGSESNDEMSQVEIFDDLAKAIERAPEDRRPTIWLLGHTRKQGREKTRLGLDDVAGSLQRTGQADAVITVEAHRDQGMVDYTLIVLQKSREDPEKYPEEYKFMLPEQPTLAKQPSSATNDAEKVRTFFKEYPKASTETARQTLHMSWKRIKQIKDSLE